MSECAEPGCTRQDLNAKGLCHRCYQRDRRRRKGRVNEAKVFTDEVFMACPDQLLALADAISEIDARNIVRLIWPHLLEASLAGIEPFTIELPA